MNAIRERIDELFTSLQEARLDLLPHLTTDAARKAYRQTVIREIELRNEVERLRRMVPAQRRPVPPQRGAA